MDCGDDAAVAGGGLVRNPTAAWRCVEGQGWCLGKSRNTVIEASFMLESFLSILVQIVEM